MDGIAVPYAVALTTIVHHGMNVMTSLRESPRDLMHMDAAPGFTGKSLVRRNVQNPHQVARGPSTPKKGPVRTFPKRATSSIRTWVKPRATKRAEAEGAGLPTM